MKHAPHMSRVALVVLLATALAIAVSSAQAFFKPLASADRFPGGYDAAILAYNSSIWAFGGISPDGSRQTTVYYSADQGLSWRSLFVYPSSFLTTIGPSLFLTPPSYSSTAGYGVCSAFGRNPVGCGETPSLKFFSSNGLVLSDRTIGGARSFAMTTMWWPSRTGSSGVSLMIGGTACNSGYYNDVWMITDQSIAQYGVAGFSPRAGSGIATLQQRSIIIIAAGGAESSFNDVWVGSQVGLNPAPVWRQIGVAPFSGRVSMVSTSTDYLFTVSAANVMNDVWMSADGGYSWIAVATNDAFPARRGANLVAVGRQLLLFGGTNSSTVFTDVWTAWSP